MDSWCKWFTPHFTISIINNISINLVSQSYTTKKSTILSFYQQSLPLIKGGYQRPSTAQRSTLVVLRLRPPTKVVCLLTVLCSVYIIIWLSLVSVYNNQRSISLDYPGQDRLPNWLSGVSQPRVIRGMSAITPLVLLAAMLTLLLAHIPPLSGCNIVYILSQDCFGQSS